MDYHGEVMTGSTPPPGFREHDTDEVVTISRDPRDNPAAPPAARRAPGPAVPAGQAGVIDRSRWSIPIGIIAAGVVAAGLFGALSLLKAHDDLSAVRAEREQLRGQLDDALAKAAVAEKERADLSEKLVVAERAANKAEKTVAKTSKKADELEDKLRSLASETASEVERDGERLTLKLVDKVLFRSGESELTARGKKYLKKVGEALSKAEDKQIWVQGHTDNVPVAKSNSRFASNWELSAARALTVVHFLQKEVGISGRRLAAVAFSKYRPASRRRKAKNRRIEIVLAPRRVNLVD